MFWHTFEPANVSFIPCLVVTILEFYTSILFWFLGSYYNNIYLKDLYFFLGCTPNWGGVTDQPKAGIFLMYPLG